jgi:hypothetical protein
MAQSRFYANTAVPTTLTSNIGPGNLTINVASSTGYPTTPFGAALDYGTSSEEVVLVTAVAGTVWTVTRAYDGTSATSHNVGAGVRHTWIAKDGNDSRSHEGSSIGVHGIGGASSVVGTTDVQTLTNKTLTTPTINGGSVNGAAVINTTSTVRATGMASAFTESAAAEVVSSTSYTSGAIPVFTTAIAPPSGKLMVVARCQLYINTDGPILFAAVQAVGSSSGTLRSANDATAMKLINGSGQDNQPGTESYIVSGATPGETVTFTWMFRVNANAAQIDYRNISAVPLIG